MDDDQPIEPTPDSSAENDEFVPYIIARHKVIVREEPTGGQTEYVIVRDKIEPVPLKVMGDTALARFLLLGFDTEYQPLKQFYTQDEVTKKKQAFYEVLSYQIYAKLDGQCFREIVIPHPNSRMTFADFITYAIAKLTAAGTSIPRVAVLVGHFNKADFPAFADRGQTFRNLVAIRNSLVTLAYPVRVRITFSDDPDDFEEIRVYIRDSYLMLPAGQRSLAAAGELIGKPKIKLHDDPEIELDLKRNMKVVRDNNWELFREYALLDAEISALYFEQVTQLYRAVTGTNRIPTSLSNIGPQLLVNDWESRTPPIDRLKMIGKESHREEVWNDKTGSFYTQKSEPYIEELFYHIDFVTACFHGGRGEQMWFGPSERDDFSDYDLASAYPTAMAMLREPLWDTVRPTRDLEDLRFGKFSFAWVEFEFPNSVRYPTLPVRTDHGLIFPRRGLSRCCAPEIEVARNLGAEIRIKHAITIDTTEELVFFSFINRSIRLRQEAKTDLDRGFWKEVTNACYGKTAQGLRQKRVFNLKTKNTKPVPESPITNPFFAAQITSLVRAVVGEMMNAIPRDKSIFSVTTDGFLTNATTEEMEWTQSGTVATAFGTIRQRLTGSADIITKKHSVKRLLGIRTRGQATLESDMSAGSKGIVLAKAGIKTPTYATTTEEQNDYIIQAFLERVPGRKFIVDTHTTLREILLFNADLVTKRGNRAIGMEFDYKRCPEQAWDASVTYQGKNYKHLAFTTKPWNTIEEFKDTRKIWESYSRVKVREKPASPKDKAKVVTKQIRCLKTIADFRAFATLHDMKVAVKGKSRAYLTSDLKRLRRDLCRAFQQGEAGLEGLRDRITARQFADLLNSCGFEGDQTVTRQNVEYGLRGQFKQHETPPTIKVLRVLRKLSQVVPALRAQDLIPDLRGLPMLMRALKVQ
jgi:DNA polymerase type B, organellar and viral